MNRVEINFYKIEYVATIGEDVQNLETADGQEVKVAGNFKYCT